MTGNLKNVQGMAIVMLVLAALTLAAYVVAPIVKPVEATLLDTSAQRIASHMLATAVGAALVLALAYATRNHKAWEIDSRRIVYMAIGAAMYGVFAWLFNGSTFNIPAVSQVSIRPAVVLPVLFGFLFGPAVGFVAGMGGNIIGDLFVGVVYPQWSFGNGLIGLAAGLPMILGDDKKAITIAMWITAAGSVASALFFYANPMVEFYPPPDFAPTQLSLLLGYSVVAGGGLVIALRYAFPNRQEWALAALWGAVGNIIGLAFASVADVWLDGLSFPVAIVGEFIPAAGPNMFALAILVPTLMLVYASAKEE